MTKARLAYVLEKLENMSEKFLDKNVYPQPKYKGGNIYKDSKTLRRARAHEDKSKQEFNVFLNDLFCGLNKVTSSETQETTAKLNNILDPSHSEQEIIDLFNRSYYLGRSTFKTSCDILKDPRIKLKSAEYFSRAIEQGGTILQQWTPQQRDMFQLHVANKMWILKDRLQARTKLFNDYNLRWRNYLLSKDSAQQLNRSSLSQLCWALVATEAVPVSSLINNTNENWRSIFAVWQKLFSLRKIETLNDSEIDVKDQHLWRGLMRLSPIPKTASLDGNGNTAADMLERLLKESAIPATSATAPHQIRQNLLEFAKTSKDLRLLETLAESSRDEQDTTTTMNIVAARLLIRNVK